jgi:selenocysteine lyase/cysteine desulfurase
MAENLQQFYDYLLAHNVKLSIRRGILRFSMHIYNNAEDVERVLALAGEFFGKKAMG